MLTDKDKRLIDKVKAMSDSNISQRIIWGWVFLLLCVASIAVFAVKLSGNGLSGSGESWEMYALLILTTFAMGYGALTTGKLLGIIKRLSN